MPDQKYTLDPAIPAASLLTAVLPIASGGLDYKVTPQQLQGNLNNAGAAFTVGSVIFAGAGGLFAEDNNNLFWNSASHILSVSTGTDHTGTDSINVYNEIDAYNPNSAQGVIGSGTDSGYTASSSRGTGLIPIVLNSGDLAGGYSGWGYTGSSPAYQSLAGMWITAQGAASTLGGKLDFRTRADGGTLTSRLTIDNAGNASFTQGAQSSSWGKSLLMTPGTLTALTAATEFIDRDFSNGTWTWIDGTVAAQRFNYFRGYTLNKTTTSATFTTAYTAYFDAPVAGTGVTITAGYSAGFNSAIRVGSTGFAGTIDIARASDGSVTGSISTNGFNNVYANSQGSGHVFSITGTTYLTIGTLGSIKAFQNTITSAWLPAFWTTTGTHTNITANSEQTDYIFGGLTGDGGFNSGGSLAGGTGNKTWLAGTVTTQRDFYIRGETYKGASATATFTNAYTLYVDPPAAGTNATITNIWAAGFAGSVSIAGGSAAGVGNITIHSPSQSPFGLRIFNDTVSTTIAGLSTYINNSGDSFIGNESATRSLIFFVNGTSTARLTIANNGNTMVGQGSNNNSFFYVFQPNLSSAWLPAFRLDGGSHTNATASELFDVNFNLARTVQFTGSTGFTTQRAFLIQAPTYAFVSATGTITNAYTLYVDKAPQVGTNAAITNSFAAGFGGRVQFTQTTTTSPIQIIGFTADPSVPVEGEISYNTTSHLLKFYNGSSWVSTAGGTGWAVTGSTTITGNTTQTGAFTNTFSLNGININQNAVAGGTAGTALALNINPGAHTARNPYGFGDDVSLFLQRTVQYVTGNLSGNTAVLINTPTWAFVGASTITDAILIQLGTGPLAGTNATITNTHSLYISSASVNATNSYGLTVNAMTGATNNYSAQFIGGFGVQLNHLQGNTSAPSIASGTGAGTSPTVTIPAGNDLDGVISIVTGTGSPAATAIVATITFNQTYKTAPKVVIYPANRAARDLAIGAWPIVPANGQTNGVTTTTFVLESGTALATSTTYLWHYHVIS